MWTCLCLPSIEKIPTFGSRFFLGNLPRSRPDSERLCGCRFFTLPQK